MSNYIASRDLPYKIRQMEFKDVDIVESIQDKLLSGFWNKTKLINSLEVGYCCRVVEVDRQIVGYGVTSETHLLEAEILNIFIVKSWQGMGIGRGLINHFVNYWNNRGKEEIFLEVALSNFNARALYLKMKFLDIGRRPNYYRNKQGKKEDALIMRLKL